MRLWRTLKNLGSSFQKINARTLIFVTELCLWAVSMGTYLLLICVVLIWPEVMTSLGLQPFVDYVTYDLQFDAHLNLSKQQLWGPDFEVYYFYVQAASILIIATFLFISSVVALCLTLLFFEVYCELYDEVFSSMLSWKLSVILLVFIPVFLLLSHDLLFEGPNSISDFDRGYGLVLYNTILRWFIILWMHYIIVLFARVYVTRMVGRIFGRLKD